MHHEPGSTFSPNYSSASRRFRQAASNIGWKLESYSIGATGPDGNELAFDVACSEAEDWDRTLVISTGLHGIEAFFGSAVQIALLDRWSTQALPATRFVFLHGLNPYGFAWLRRFDENNVDPNRNFLLPDERFEGAPKGYAELDSFLNPRCPPSRLEPFVVKAIPLIARYGMSSLRQAIASGQYTHPSGLFFGGSGPSRVQHLLREHMPRWLRGSNQVVHLDFHTGLGRSGECKLLIDYPLNERQNKWLIDWFGSDSFETCHSQGDSYDARGGFGRWCVSQNLAPHYLFACAEFGTYHSLKVLSGLRAENQAHHWGDFNGISTIRAKQQIMELFCPASTKWRSKVIELSHKIVGQAIRGLMETPRA